MDFDLTPNLREAYALGNVPSSWRDVTEVNKPKIQMFPSNEHLNLQLHVSLYRSDLISSFGGT